MSIEIEVASTPIEIEVASTPIEIEVASTGLQGMQGVPGDLSPEGQAQAGVAVEAAAAALASEQAAASSEADAAQSEQAAGIHAGLATVGNLYLYINYA